MQVPSPAPEHAEITLVESDACHFCADASDVLAGLAARFPLHVRSVDVRSGTGRELMTRHRATMSPLVLLDGAFFSNGRLPRRKLERELVARYGEPDAIETGSGRRRG